MEATRSCETSVYNKPTQRYIPEDGILQVPFPLTSVSVDIVALVFTRL
jgi:hypothetical protein